MIYMMKIRFLSNSLYSLKSCHKPFDPHPLQCPNKHTCGWGFFKLVSLGFKNYMCGGHVCHKLWHLQHVSAGGSHCCHTEVAVFSIPLTCFQTPSRQSCHVSSAPFISLNCFVWKQTDFWQKHQTWRRLKFNDVWRRKEHECNTIQSSHDRRILKC